MKKLLIITLLIVGCDRYEYVNDNKKFDKWTGNTYIKKMVTKYDEELLKSSYTNLSNDMQEAIQWFRYKEPQNENISNYTLYKMLKEGYHNFDTTFIWKEVDEGKHIISQKKKWINP